MDAPPLITIEYMLKIFLKIYKMILHVFDVNVQIKSMMISSETQSY